MAKEGRLFGLLALGVDGFYFPDTLVHLSDQATAAAELVGIEIPVASQAALEEHHKELFATPTFVQHMHVFQGAHAMRDMTSLLAQEFGMTLASDDVFACAQDPDCIEVWTTARALMGKTIRIVDVLGSWNMTETGVGNVCHVNKDKDHALCHIQSDVYKTGVSWMALGRPVDAPDVQTPLPVAVRCHDMGLSKLDMLKHGLQVHACHLLSGNEFMAVRADAIRAEAVGDTSGLMEIDDEPRIPIDSLHYPPPKPYYRTISPSSNTNLCLDVPADDSANPDMGVQLWLWECNGSESQHWVFNTAIPTATILRYSPQRHLCLDAGDMSNGRQLILWECDAGGTEWPQQMWSYDEDASRMYLDGTSVCLDYYSDWGSNGQPLHVWECNGLSNQEWVFGERLPEPSEEMVV